MRDRKFVKRISLYQLKICCALTVCVNFRKKLQSTRSTSCSSGSPSSSTSSEEKVNHSNYFGSLVNCLIFRVCSLCTRTLLHWHWQFCPKPVVPRYGHGLVGTLPRRLIPNVQEKLWPQNRASDREPDDQTHWESARGAHNSQRHQTRQLFDWRHRINQGLSVYHRLWFGQMLPKLRRWAHSIQRRQKFDWNRSLCVNQHAQGCWAVT